MEEQSPHRPVLYHEIIHALRPIGGGRYVDGTLGAGGHAAGILEASSPDGQLLGLDVDAEALELARGRLTEFGGRARLVHGSYAELTRHLGEAGWEAVNGVLLDLGASSMQFDRAERGFSFREAGPLDMRFDLEAATTAADLVNGLPEVELADLLFQYGEERKSRRVAKAIVRARPLEDTRQLAEVVAKALGRRRGGIHPATRTFQALRIAVNGEMQAIQSVLPQAVEALKPGGVLAVISFHSLEDRLVKRFMREASREVSRQPDDPPEMVERNAVLKLARRGALRPGEDEIRQNPRARSARLRVAEKIE